MTVLRKILFLLTLHSVSVHGGWLSTIAWSPLKVPHFVGMNFLRGTPVLNQFAQAHDALISSHRKDYVQTFFANVCKKIPNVLIAGTLLHFTFEEISSLSLTSKLKFGLAGLGMWSLYAANEQFKDEESKRNIKDIKNGVGILDSKVNGAVNLLTEVAATSQATHFNVQVANHQIARLTDQNLELLRHTKDTHQRVVGVLNNQAHTHQQTRAVREEVRIVRQDVARLYELVLHNNHLLAQVLNARKEHLGESSAASMEPVAAVAQDFSLPGGAVLQESEDYQTPDSSPARPDGNASVGSKRVKRSAFQPSNDAAQHESVPSLDSSVATFGDSMPSFKPLPTFSPLSFESNSSAHAGQSTRQRSSRRSSHSSQRPYRVMRSLSLLSEFSFQGEATALSPVREEITQQPPLRFQAPFPAAQVVSSASVTPSRSRVGLLAAWALGTDHFLKR